MMVTTVAIYFYMIAVLILVAKRQLFRMSEPASTLPDPDWYYEPSDCESTSRLETVALRFAHLIKCFWKLQLVRSRFAAYGAYLQRLEASGRGLLLDILSNCYPSAEVQGRVPKLLRDRRREVLDYSCFQRFEERHGSFWEPSASSSSNGWEAAD